MKLFAAAALVSISIAALGCKSPGDAFADDACACKDKECVEKVMKDHETKFPESKATLGEAAKLPADKKAAYDRAIGCIMKVGMEAEKKK
jgi:hypothetical protein